VREVDNILGYNLYLNFADSIFTEYDLPHLIPPQFMEDLWDMAMLAQNFVVISSFSYTS